MRRRAPIPALTVLLAACALASWPASSQASPLAFVPCPSTAAFSCSTLAVPLDRGGGTPGLPGTVPLSVERKLSGAAPSRTALIALTGGPGQATLPLAEAIAATVAPALGSRDLLLFDQRGTGASNPLSCSAFEGPIAGAEPRINEQCALDIGPARRDFTSAETVADIEALRVAAGYDKLVLYGTSYGTKVALNYAERYPQRVEALVLDSVVPSAGEEPFYIPSYQAIGPMLAELCSGGGCAAISADPLGDLARLVALVHRHALRGSVYDGTGRRHSFGLDGVSLFSLLLAGDRNPALRALLPAAARSALRHDPDPLLRLSALSDGLVPNLPGAAMASSDELDQALFATTICEETPFPWRREGSASTRMAEALSFLHAQPPQAFSPFDTATALQASLIPACSAWPDASAAPGAAKPLPSVPTLILSGGQDLRTPTATARLVAAQIPGSQLEVVPFTGHSVLGSDLSGCATRALAAFFGGAAVTPCPATANQFAPTPVTPRRLASVRAPATLPGRAGQTLVAVLDTLVDLNRQVIGATIQASSELPSGSSFGGLRGGYARLRSSSVTLHRFAFVPGVELTGTFPIRHGVLQPATISIGGGEAVAGTVRVGSSFKRVTGALGGRRFAVSLASVHLSERGSREWPTRSAIAGLLGRIEGPSGGPSRLAPRLR